MANISTDNINTIAQLSASIDDDDYIYIFKVSSGTIARVTKAQLLQDIANSGGGISETVYAAIRNNVNTLQAKVDDIINIIRNNMATYVFPNGRPSINVVGQLYWPSGGETPTPMLLSPSSAISATLQYGSDTVAIPVSIQGSNLESALSFAITGTGFTLSTQSLSASDANNGTSIVITHTRQQGVESTATGQLVISSEDTGVGGTFNINVTYAQDQQGGGDEPSDTYTEPYDLHTNRLLLHLDGKHMGSEPNKWKDPSEDRNIVFTLTAENTIENNIENEVERPSVVSDSNGTKGVDFSTNGQFAVCNKTNLLEDLGYENCLIEVCFTANNDFLDTGKIRPFFVTNGNDNIACIFGYAKDRGYKHFDYRTASSTSTGNAWVVDNPYSDAFPPQGVTLFRVSMSKDLLIINGISYTTRFTQAIAPLPSSGNNPALPILVGGRRTVDNNGTYHRSCHAIIHDVRIYDIRNLSEEQVSALISYNQGKDDERYGTGNS